MPLPALRLICLAVSLTVTTHAFAAIDGVVRRTHPRLYATPAELTALNKYFSGGRLPAKRGEISFTVTTHLRAEGDSQDGVVFGGYNNPVSAILIRHIDSLDITTGTPKVRLQVAFTVPGEASYAAYGELSLSPGEPTKVTLSYDTEQHTASLVTDKAGAVSKQIAYNAALFARWLPGETTPKFDFAYVRRNDVVSGLQVKDLVANQVLWSHERIDSQLNAARGSLLWAADKTSGSIATCMTASEPATLCNVAQNGRGDTLGTAKQLALAYQISNRSVAYAKAARAYAELIMGVTDLAAGREWAMAARVGALGVLYDWFYNDPEFDAELKRKIRATIRDTIRTDVPEVGGKQDDDLIEMICGTPKLAPSTSLLDCASKPDLSRSYLGGHQFSAMTGAALGLLAILDESVNEGHDVTPLIIRIYDHMIEGMIPARNYASGEGGHHMLYAYGANVAEVIERLVMWRRAIVPSSGTTVAPTTFESKVIRPYIYALHADNTFPAAGDAFELVLPEPTLGYMALAAATQGDGVATTFYEKHVQSARPWASAQLLWDRLYFPATRQPAAELSTLPLSARYRVAGNVYMRDSWDREKSTLLEFKSTSFISENHQHLDQNSFTIYKRAPLLVDSGLYNEYDSTHWKNYYRRTIAHNSIVVFDPNEQFLYDSKPMSNDGGQWIKRRVGDAGQERYPTIAEIQPGARNALDGVTHYEEDKEGGYAFVTGNASKAYSTKLDQNDGFLRSILYLRPTSTSPKTTVLVFDRIHAPGRLAATSLLHTVKKPQSHATQHADSIAGGGRVVLAPTPTNLPLLVRNGDGMVTIEPLLPENARITLAGGTDGAPCDQEPADVNYTDCRFTARVATGGGSFAWRNFPAIPGSETHPVTTDAGNWRIEIAAVDEGRSAPDAYQWFLNVLHVEDNRLEADPTENTAKLLPSSDGSAAAVALESGGTVVFAKRSAAAASLRWKAGCGFRGTVIATGLVSGQTYRWQCDTGTQEIVLAATGTQAAGTASGEGVLKFTVR
ncbi:heparinase II/III domain-containing protein [Pseudoduganella armeniaca]|uniref:Heparinase II/III-like C-terminal domain-containing protein n=1 Tax=Pseudoduganella armeniaca TaxID=2072590 RepID=A0A2R4C824_9BURK|nr:heparinase II/III family protein [Pseudoduganella armeniaca]AVR95756.1 hypothetical protein C9I28_08465 [Pseudoduganella armeniaca]